MKLIIILLVAMILSCKATKFENGSYRVETARNLNGKSVVKFEGINKEFVFETDTLKRGDLVYFAQRPANVQVRY